MFVALLGIGIGPQSLCGPSFALMVFDSCSDIVEFHQVAAGECQARQVGGFIGANFDQIRTLAGDPNAADQQGVGDIIGQRLCQ